MSKRNKIRVLCLFIGGICIIILSYMIEITLPITFIILILVIGLFLTQDKLERYE